MGRENRQNRAAKVGYGLNVATLTGNTSLTAKSAKHQSLTASGGNRNVTLPSLASSKGLSFLITNAGASNNLVVKDPAATTLITLTPGMACIVAGNGTVWKLVIAGDATATGNDFGTAGILTDKIDQSTTAGLEILTAATEKLGFFGATRAVQPSGAGQTALTDSTGGSVANATLAANVLTDNSGGAAADWTIGAVTAPAAITDSSGGVDPGNNTIAVVTNPDLSAWNGATDPTATQATAVGTAFTAAKAAIAQLAAKQNVDRTAIIALTDAVKELSTACNNSNDSLAKTAVLVNKMRTDLVALGLLKGSA